MNEIKPKTLYIVGTPIGNLGDLSPRAAKVLAEVDFIAAEDTRVTKKLLAHIGANTPLVSYHQHNRSKSGAGIVSRLAAGESAALVTDAGMPAISDPGQELVELCAASGIDVAVVPGPSALTCALALSGLPSGRFCFEGFLSTAGGRRRAHLEQLRSETRAMVFYEAPHKLLDTLKDMLEVLGDRDITLSREMTKLHEETLRLTLSEAAERFSQTPPRGEFVLVVSGSPPPVREEQNGGALELARMYVEEGMSLRDAARAAAKETGAQRSALYAGLLEDKKQEC